MFTCFYVCVSGTIFLFVRLVYSFRVAFLGLQQLNFMLTENGILFLQNKMDQTAIFFYKKQGHFNSFLNSGIFKSFCSIFASKSSPKAVIFSEGPTTIVWFFKFTFLKNITPTQIDWNGRKYVAVVSVSNFVGFRTFVGVASLWKLKFQ